MSHQSKQGAYAKMTLMDMKYKSARALYTALVRQRILLDTRHRESLRNLAYFEKQLRNIADELIRAIDQVNLAGHDEFFLKRINEAVVRKDLLIYFDNELYTVSCQCIAVPSCLELPNGIYVRVLPDLKNGYRVEKIDDPENLILWKAMELNSDQ